MKQLLLRNILMEIMKPKMILCEMALTLKPNETGLPFDVWVSEKEYATTRHHRPRLKVYSKQKRINTSVAIDDPIQVLAGTPISGRHWTLLKRYIKTNQQLFLALWNEEISQSTVVVQQKSLLKEGLNEMIIPIPKYVYHGTLRAELPSILKFGLLPRSNPQHPAFEKSVKWIFLTTLVSIARDETEELIDPLEELDKIIVLIIDTTQLDKRLFSLDPEYRDYMGQKQWLRYKGVITPSSIMDYGFGVSKKNIDNFRKIRIR